jgi:cytochrome P450
MNHTTTTPASPLPGPAGWPLVGALPAMLRAGVFEYVEQCWRRHGDLFQIPTAGRGRILFTSHPDAIEHVLQTRADNFYKGKGYDPIRPLLGNGLITSNGEFWVHQRKLTQPAFHLANLRRHVPIMDRCTAATLARWAAAPGQVLDLHAEMMALTQHIVGHTLFGMDLSDRAAASTRAVHESLAIAGQRMNRGALVVPLAVPTPANLRYRRALRTLDAIVYDIIAHARRAGSDDTPTLLRLLMQARDEVTGEGMSDRQLRDEIVTHYVAGHETTALVLTWTLYLLARHPNALARVRDEVAALDPGAPPTLEALDALTYTRMVLDEVMRLHPPVWAQTRVAREDDVLLGRPIPAGSFVMFSAFFCHRHPDFWDDPELFLPERFAPERARARHRFAHIPFSAGPRACIGKRYALYELCTILARVLSTFRVDPLPGPRVGIKATATVHPDRPVLVRVTPARA